MWGDQHERNNKPEVNNKQFINENIDEKGWIVRSAKTKRADWADDSRKYGIEGQEEQGFKEIDWKFWKTDGVNEYQDPAA